MPRFTKSERLCSKLSIDLLFANGKSFFVYPFKVFWYSPKYDFEQPAQILISIPRKNFKHAVTRNLLKRRIREIYRKNKTDFYQNLKRSEVKCVFALIYTGRQVLEPRVLEPKIIVILQRLIQENVEAIG